MNDFPAFAAIIGLLGLIRSLSLLGEESFKDLQAEILGDASYFFRAGLGALCAFFSYRLFSCNTYGFSKGELFASLLLFLGNVFWTAVFIIPPKDSKLLLKIKSLYNKVLCKITGHSSDTKTISDDSKEKIAALQYSSSFRLEEVAAQAIRNDLSFETYFLMKMEKLPAINSIELLREYNELVYDAYWESFEVYSRSVCNEFVRLFTQNLPAEEVQTFNRIIANKPKQHPDTADSLFLVSDLFNCAADLCWFPTYEETFLKDHIKSLNYQQVHKPFKIALDKFNETFKISEDELKNVLMPN